MRNSERKTEVSKKRGDEGNQGDHVAGVSKDV